MTHGLGSAWFPHDHLESVTNSRICSLMEIRFKNFLSLGLNPYFTQASLGRKLSHESSSKFLEYKVRHFSVRDRDPLLIKQIGYAI